MGKRYGRNQKRKHREVIARQQESLNFKEITLSRCRRELRDKDWLFERLVQVLRRINPNHALLSPSKVPRRILAGRSLQLHQYQPFVLARTEDPLQETTELSYDTLIQLILEVEEGKFPELGKMAHLICSDGGHYAYYMSEEAITNLGFHPGMVEHMLDQLLHKYQIDKREKAARGRP